MPGSALFIRFHSEPPHLPARRPVFPTHHSSVLATLFPEEALGPLGAEQWERDRALRPQTARNSEAGCLLTWSALTPPSAESDTGQGVELRAGAKADFSSDRLRVMTNEVEICVRTASGLHVEFVLLK